MSCVDTSQRLVIPGQHGHGDRGVDCGHGIDSWSFSVEDNVVEVGASMIKRLGML